MKPTDTQLLEEAYKHVEKTLNESSSARGVAIDVYLRREPGFESKKKQVFTSLKTKIPNVKPFGNTFSNGSGVLEVTIPYEKWKLEQDVELLPPEDKQEYEDILRNIGINSFDVYES